MILYTNDKVSYEVNWLEYWDDPERCIVAETKDGDVIKIDLDDFDRVEESEKKGETDA